MQRFCVLMAIMLATTTICFSEDDFEESKVSHKLELLGGKIQRDNSLPGRPVIGVSFRETNKFSDKYIHLLKVFKRLKSLDFDGISITEVGLAEITDLRKSLPDLIVTYDDPQEAAAIVKLGRIGGSVVRDEKLPGRLVSGVMFFAGAPNANLRFNDAQMPLLNEFTNLTTLSIPYSGITDVGLKTLNKQKRLVSLNLFAATITDVGLKDIAELTQLKSLRLDACKQITDVGLKELGLLKQLNVLGLGGTAITDAGLKELKDLPNLRMLNLSDTAITDAGLRELSEFENLTALDLAKTKVTDAGLQQLCKLESLSVLDLMFCKGVTDAGINELCSIKSLTRLRLLETEVTDAGLNQLKKYLPDALIVR